MMSRSLQIIGLMLSLASAGCDKLPSNAPSAAQTGYIAFVGAAEDDPYWPVLRASAEQYREGLGGLRLVTKAPSTRSAAAQIQLLHALPASSLRGICIVPADAKSDALRDALCELETRGVKVITLVDRVSCADELPFAGVDEVALGHAMADALIETLHGEGTVALLVDGTAERHIEDRLVGFRERMRSAPGVRVQKEIDAQRDPSGAKRAMQEYTERFPRLDAWVAIDNWPLQDVSGEPLLLPTDCRLITSTPLPQYWGRLRDRTCAALIGVRYERIADAALRMCSAAAQQEPLPSRIYLAPPVTVTAKNLNWYQAYWFESLKRPTDVRQTEETVDDAP
jgi:ABC-type sugar transport system substrate-binding protein